ncbi:MAG TPA: DUF4142 domain-containing protein [Gemmatimonadales bacterium]|nr:DUF4142 domain-containing protein [Gemmatimonadales bacterium]
MCTTRNTPISRFAQAVALAVALTAAPALWAQDTTTRRGGQVPGTTPTSIDPRVPTPAPTNPPPTTNPTATPAVPQAAAQGLADTAFVRQVRADNLLEIRLGSLAQRRSTNAAVKQFAQRMVTDHTTMGNEWTSLANQTHLGTTFALDATQQQVVSQLSSVPAADFDRQYMTTMVQNHQGLLSTLQQVGPTAQTPAVRQLAAQGVPIAQQHLTLAQQVATQVGASVATNPAGLPQRTATGQVVTTAGAKNANTGRADAPYVQELWRAHEMQVELAQLAEQRARDSKVKDFASNMRTDFKDYLDRWSDLASKNGMTLPNHIGNLHQDKVDRLKKASKNEVDRVYLDIVKETVGGLVPYYQKEGHQVQSSAVRNLVNQELPILQRHLSRAETLDRQVTASANSNRKDKDKDKDKR